MHIIVYRIKRVHGANHFTWHLSYNSISSFKYEALFVLDLSVCDYVMLKHLCPSDLCHQGV